MLINVECIQKQNTARGPKVFFYLSLALKVQLDDIITDVSGLNVICVSITLLLFTLNVICVSTTLEQHSNTNVNDKTQITMITMITSYLTMISRKDPL